MPASPDRHASTFVPDLSRLWRDVDVPVSDMELVCRYDRRERYLHIIVRVARAIQTEQTRPFREVLGMQGQARE